MHYSIIIIFKGSCCCLFIRGNNSSYDNINGWILFICIINGITFVKWYQSVYYIEKFKLNNLMTLSNYYSSECIKYAMAERANH